MNYSNKTEIIRLSEVIKRGYVSPLEKLLVVLLKISSKKSTSPALKMKPGEWGKLKEIRISNFKTIENAVIPLADVTILVGPNSSGKSSVLQAAHWAARAASYITPKNTKEVISFDRLDYLPSSRPLATAYLGELGSGVNQSHTAVSFVQKALGSAVPVLATVKIWAARNKGAISAHIEGGPAVTPFKQRNRPITAYIPGLAGLAERETILAQPQMRRHAASGDAGGVLRNILYNLATRQGNEVASEPNDRLKKINELFVIKGTETAAELIERLKNLEEVFTQQGNESESEPLKRLRRLNDFLGEVHPNFNIDVSFDEREDIHINATYTNSKFNSFPLPLEGLATGILQVIQIFAYLILFRPRILLVDEPDAHLHPDKQERLIETLERAAKEFGTQIIITTHSQHIVRSAAATTKMVWMNQGKVVSNDDNSIRSLMGWGALDKKILFFVEDEDDQAIRCILRQWPALNRMVSICRCFGVDNLPKKSLLKGLIHENEIQLDVVLHRDRDFMSSDESETWAAQYDGSYPWVTKFVDVEAYFCQSEYLSSLYNVTLEEASVWIDSAVNSIKGAKQLFKDKREIVRRMLYPDGGSPNSELSWDKFGGQTFSTVLGKSLYKALKVVVKNAGKNEHLLSSYTIPAGFEIASDLRIVLESAIRKKNVLA